jgi:hypothetical protein
VSILGRAKRLGGGRHAASGDGAVLARPWWAALALSLARPPRSANRRRADYFPPESVAGKVFRVARWVALATWAVLLVYFWHRDGVPFDREGLLTWVCFGVLAGSVGRHPMALLQVVIDFVPFALVLIAYDYLRGASYQLGMPTWWHPQVDADKFLFFGHEPTVWLQAHLKHPYPNVQWYGVAVTLCYCSFFFLPYIAAGVFWLRDRATFYRWSLRFVSLSFIGFATFALFPAAPPWAAARCSAADVASHPSEPFCMWQEAPGNATAVHGGLLGDMTTHIQGANPWVERISWWGFHDLHLSVAGSLLKEGQAVSDPVAAVPSLHLGGTVLFVLFMWRRVSKWWRPLLAVYPFAMTFSLAYSGEHYVFDCLTGALAAVIVTVVSMRLERWWRRRKRSTNPDVDSGALKLRMLASIAAQRKRVADDGDGLESASDDSASEVPG